MRAVVQRVKQASVTVNGQLVGTIGEGLLVFLGIGNGDSDCDAEYLAVKIANLRIFEDLQGKMNLSLFDVQGELLVVSQFTLYGDCRKGRRPGFDAAAPSEQARVLYETFITLCRQQNLKVATGQFQTEMMISSVNHGPVTLLLDSGKIF